jgi:transforming growth factor-beta-induced protein
VTPILLYHMIQGTLAVGSIAVGPPVFASTLLVDPSWTNVTGGQHLMVNKQPSNVVVFVSGQGTRATLIQGDIRFSGGLIHVLDNLLIPPGPLNATLTAFQDLPFLGALYAADVYEAFSTQPNCTIFAPSSLGLEAVNNTLSTMTARDLAQILDYHVVPGAVLPSTSLVNGTQLATSSPGTGQDDVSQLLYIRRSGNSLYVNSAQIVQPDILFANGVIHIVDNVLNPAVAGVVPDPDLPEQPPVFASAVDVATMTDTALPFTTALPCSVSCPVSTSASAGPNATASVLLSSTSTVNDELHTSTSRAGAMRARCTGARAGIGMVEVGLGALGVAWAAC